MQTWFDSNEMRHNQVKLKKYIFLFRYPFVPVFLRNVVATREYNLCSIEKYALYMSQLFC